MLYNSTSNKEFESSQLTGKVYNARHVLLKRTQHMPCKFKRLVCKSSLPVKKVKAKRQNHTSLHLVPLSPRDLRDVAWSRKTRTSRRRHASLRCTLVVVRGVVASRYFTSNLPWIQEFKWIWSLQEPPFFCRNSTGAVLRVKTKMLLKQTMSEPSFKPPPASYADEKPLEENPGQ